MVKGTQPNKEHPWVFDSRSVDQPQIHALYPVPGWALRIHRPVNFLDMYADQTFMGSREDDAEPQVFV